MNPQVDQYLIEGCMRCELGGTPDCKVHNWQSELMELRRIVLETELTERVKWGVPCYTYQDKNVITLSALKDFAALSFFKGSLMEDELGLLIAPGPNSQAARYLKFTSLPQVLSGKQYIKAYVQQAIEIEKSGQKVLFKKYPEPMPPELENALEEDPVLKSAFESLTPGRQRGYILYFSQPKQSKTRMARIEKYTPQILNGVGMHDHYKSRK